MGRRQTREALGGRIRLAREEAGWRIEQLAAELGIGVNTARRWEAGEFEPKFLQVARIAEIFDRPVEWFTDEVSV